jgi:hypothetical protein
MTREYEYDIIRYDKVGGSMGRVWWDGKKVASDNDQVLNMIEDATIDGLTSKAGIPFLEALPRFFNSAYLSARRVQED